MFEQTTAAYAGANAQVALLRQQLADSTLRSPVDGIVAEKRTDVGARLGEAGVAFVVVQLSPLKLRFQVPERYLGKINAATASPRASIRIRARRSKERSRPSAASSIRKRARCSPKPSSPIATAGCARACSRAVETKLK
jgi:multidrug efflux pump subunit AcrA (membrane-fusion protein)